MKHLLAVMILSGTLAGAEALAQEHKHEEQKGESKAPVGKGGDAAKADGMKCCEEMKKMEGKGTPMKAEMKAKMEKMKEMKEKMAEKMKMKAAESVPGLESKFGEPKEPEKTPHQH